MSRNYSILFVLCLAFVISCLNDGLRKNPERLEKNNVNSHLLETISGKPVFLNNFTLWKLVEHGNRQDAEEILNICRDNNYNMVSSMILGISSWSGNDYNAGVSPYGDHAFESDSQGFPDPLKPIVTPGNDFNDPEQYDFWDHVEYIIDLAAKKGMYIGLHPAGAIGSQVLCMARNRKMFCFLMISRHINTDNGLDRGSEIKKM